MRGRLRGPSIAALLITAALTTGFASTSVGQADRLSTDLQLVAAAAGWTPSEALAYERSATALDEIAVRLAAEHPGTFVVSELSVSPYGVPNVYFKGVATPEVRAIVAAAQVPINVIDGLIYSREELYQQRVEIYEELVRAGYSNFGISTDLTGRAAIHRVDIAFHASLATTPDAILALLPAHLATRASINVLDGPVAVLDSTAYGGMKGASGANLYCNVGWSVLHTNTSISGVTTAGHCTDTAGELDGVKHGTTVHSATERGLHMGSWGDIAWLSTSVGEPALFVADGYDNDIRDVTAVKAAGAIALNEWVCLWSWQSGYRRCTQVAAVEQSCWDSHHVVLMNQETSIPGDSGGGWSYNNRAFGSNTGRCAAGFGELRDAWMPAGYFDEALGVKVKTT